MATVEDTVLPNSERKAPSGHDPLLRDRAAPADRGTGPPGGVPGGPDPATLTTEHLEAELISCAALENACRARFLALLAEFVAREGWSAWGCVSAVQWLSWQCGLGRVAASEHLRVARTLPDLPAIAAAFASGALSWSKVRAVTRVADPATDEVWAGWARSATGAQLEAIVMSAKRITATDVERQEATEQLTRRSDDDGSIVFTWRVPAEAGAALVAALEAELEPEQGVPAARSRSQAMTRLVLGRECVTPEVLVHVDAATGTAVSEHGVAVPVEVAGVGICNGAHSVVLHQPDGGLAVSDRRRQPTERARRALRARDRHCRMPGCHLQGGLEMHHIEHYHHGGSRRLHNLVRLCPGHHRIVHRHRLTLAWGSDGALIAHWPDGSPLADLTDTTAHPDDHPGSRLAPFAAPAPVETPTAPWEGQHLDHACIDAALHGLRDMSRLRGRRPSGAFPAENPPVRRSMQSGRGPQAEPATGG